MKNMILIGVVLMLLGGVVLAYPAIQYTETEEVINIGPLEATVETEKSVPLPKALGGASLIAGAAMLIGGAYRGAKTSD